MSYREKKSFSQQKVDSQKVEASNSEGIQVILLKKSKK